ncbi:MAG: penicillin-binding protein 2 [bacterium]|nr:penicillin-binding protein 2 [bacterium]
MKKNNIKKSKTKKNKSISNRRLIFLAICIVFCFTLISIYLSKLILIDGKRFKVSLKEKQEQIIYSDSAPRGRIYDRNHKLLVDNKAIPIIVYNKSKKISSMEEIKLAHKISKIIDVDYENLSLTNLKEFWIIQNKEKANSKITEEEWTKLKNRKLNQDDIYNLKIDRISEEDLSIYNDSDKKTAYIYYLMNKGYFYDEKIIKNNASDSEYAYIAEHKDELNGFDVSYTWERVYLYGDTFRTMLGNISSISAENKEEFLSKGYKLNDIVGVSYLEKQYESILKGSKSKYKLENGIRTLIEEGSRGNDIVLTIDIELQQEVERILKEQVIIAKKQSSTKYYNRSYVVIQQPNTGEILAMSGIQVVKNNNEYKTYDVTSGIVTNPMTVGSAVKGASMIVGYSTNAIKIGDVMTDNCVKIFSKPAKCSWTKLGNLDDINALAYSSNIYQFKTAMKVDGHNYVYNGKYTAKESTFDTYRKVFNEFGLGSKTGIDLPVESIGNIGKSTSADLLLNFAIGQYDTYTTMQLSQYMNTFASNGNRYAPRLLKAVYDGSKDDLSTLLYEVEPVLLNKVNVDIKYIQRVQKGFIAVVKYGTGKNIMGSINKPAGKTGTSESFLDTNNDGIVDTETLSNAFVGYAPYDNPVMTIAVTSPDLVDPKSGTNSRSYANHKISRLISEKFFELYNG